jgi:Arc/MetJ-type ribon-helix-helix transcriptional regulator
MMTSTERLLVDLPSDLVAVLRKAVRSGAFASEGDAIGALLRACYGDQSVGEEDIADVRARVAEGLADMEAGRVVNSSDLHDRLQARYRAKLPDRRMPGRSDLAAD